MSSRFAIVLALGCLLAACGGGAAPAASSAAANAKPASASAKPAGSAAASAPASGAAGATKISVAYSVASPGFWPLYMAADTGIFQKNGLDVAVQIIPGATNVAAAMVSSQIQFAQFGGGAAMSAAANGSDLVILGVLIP